MIVQELIDQLLKQDPKAKVIIPNYRYDMLAAAEGFGPNKVSAITAQEWDDPYDAWCLDPDEGETEKVVLIYSNRFHSHLEDY